VGFHLVFDASVISGVVGYIVLQFRLNYETIACNENILAGRQQNSIMPWSDTLIFQEHMKRIKQQF